MRSRRPPDLFSEADLPTSAEDVRALRAHRPRAAGNWLHDIAVLAAQMPHASRILRERPTHAGLPPFEL